MPGSPENDVVPALGARPIEAVTPADVPSVVQAIDARGAGETAGRVFQRLRAVYRYAVAHDFAKGEPSTRLALTLLMPFAVRPVELRGNLRP